MRNIQSKFSFLLAMLCLIFASPAMAITMESCDVGIEACQPLEDNIKKYTKCMSIICKDEQKKDAQKKSDILQCDIGYQKCNTLRDEPLYYWTCVDDTCRNPPKKAELNCQYGHQQCQNTLELYWVCMSETCSTPYSSNKSCPAGVKQCQPTLITYWECVSEKCLGDVYKYRDPEYYTDKVKKMPVYKYFKEEREQAIPDAYTAPPMRGVPKRFKYAPQNVNPYEWLSAIPAPSRQFKGSPTSQYKCQTNRGYIHCTSADVSSCVCSDGTELIDKDYDPIKEYKQSKIEYYRNLYSYDNPDRPYE